MTRQFGPHLHAPVILSRQKGGEGSQPQPRPPKSV